MVVAAYNAAATIGEALASALGQTLAPHEVIVCDDGSTDGTADAVAAFGDRMILLRQPNAGTAAAKNAALRVATGEFVAILDADDVFVPTRLERFGELAAQRPDLDILAADTWFEVAGQVTGRFHDAVAFAVTDQRTAILERCFLTTPAVRRSSLLAVGGFDAGLRHGSDWDCWLRLIRAGCAAGLVDEPLLRYRRHGASLTASRTPSLQARVRLLEKAWGDPTLTPHERDVLRRSIAHHRVRWVQAWAGDATTRRQAAGRWLRVAGSAGVPATVRLRALAASVLAVATAGRAAAV